jgi:ribonuclease P protein component
MQARFRLRRPADFARLRKIGHSRRHSLIVLSVAPNNLAHNRYGVIASRRLGNAVKRNRARRLMREALRHYHPHIVPGHDIVVVARKYIVGQPFDAVDDALYDLLSRAGLLTINGPTAEEQGI